MKPTLIFHLPRPDGLIGTLVLLLVAANVAVIGLALTAGVFAVTF